MCIRDRDLTGLTCSAGGSATLATGVASIDLQPGETVTCTYTNTKRGSITVVKDAQPDAAQDFTFSGTLGDFSLDDDADATLPASRLFSALLPGSFTIAEGANAAWALTNIVCLGDTGSGSSQNLAGRSVTIGLDPGENVTCTFTNSRLPTLTLLKSVVNDNGGTLTAASFPAFIGAQPAVWAIPQRLAPGAYTASETPPAGYLPGPWGGDCAPNGSVSLA